MVSYRARIFDSHGQVLRRGRWIQIDRIDEIGTAPMARVQLTGRGKWSEVERFLAENGFVARAWKTLTGAQEMRSMLDRMPG